MTIKQNLEDKILKKVYVFETKKTSTELVVKVISFILLAFGVFLFATVIIELLQEQQTLDVLEIFSEDGEVVHEYLGNIINIFNYEIPKSFVLILLVLFILLLYVILTVIRNFERIRNRIKAIIHYWIKV